MLTEGNVVPSDAGAQGQPKRPARCPKCRQSVTGTYLGRTFCGRCRLLSPSTAVTPTGAQIEESRASAVSPDWGCIMPSRRLFRTAFLSALSPVIASAVITFRSRAARPRFLEAA